jgi:hypothetical protein
MSLVVSSSTNRPYGVRRVTRVWGEPRAPLYRHRRCDQPGYPRRRQSGATPAAPGRGMNPQRGVSRLLTATIGSTLQIGSTPWTARCLSMNAIMAWSGGRAPPRQIGAPHCRISLACLSSRTSRLQSLEPLTLIDAAPPCRPPSRSAQRTHSRSVSALQPILAATKRIVAASDRCSASCSRTSRTARWRSSARYGFAVLLVIMAPSFVLPKVEASIKPARFIPLAHGDCVLGADDGESCLLSRSKSNSPRQHTKRNKLSMRGEVIGGRALRHGVRSKVGSRCGGSFVAKVADGTLPGYNKLVTD